MAASTCVADGQQRLTAIWEYISGKFDGGGRKFSDLDQRVKEDFPQYEVPVIDFDLDVNDFRLKWIFKRPRSDILCSFDNRKDCVGIYLVSFFTSRPDIERRL